LFVDFGRVEDFWYFGARSWMCSLLCHDLFVDCEDGGDVDSQVLRKGIDDMGRFCRISRNVLPVADSALNVGVSFSTSHQPLVVLEGVILLVQHEFEESS
jgi:hypothetical protein